MTGENFTSHLIFEKLDQFKKALLSENINEKLGIENYTFYSSALEFILDRLKLTIPALIYETELNTLSSEIENGTAQINAYLGNKNVGHLTNAKNNITSALNVAKALPLPLSKSDFNFTKAIAAFQSSVELSYKALEAERIKLQENLRVVNSDLTAKNEEIKKLQKQITDKDIEITNALSKYTSDFETTKVNNNTIFEDERKKFNDVIESDRKLYKEQTETINNANLKKFDIQSKKIDSDSIEIIKKLSVKLSEAEKIVNIVGNVGVTGNYQNIANQNKKMANVFRIIALLFMILMSGLLIWSIIELSHGEFNLYKSLVRILAAAILTYPAVYAARESNKHRKLEIQNRKLELELASIGPFIELLSDEKKQMIKEELVKKYFGNQALDSDPKEDEDISINGLEKILKTILPYIKK